MKVTPYRRQTTSGAQTDILDLIEKLNLMDNTPISSVQSISKRMYFSPCKNSENLSLETLTLLIESNGTVS